MTVAGQVTQPEHGGSGYLNGVLVSACYLYHAVVHLAVEAFDGVRPPDRPAAGHRSRTCTGSASEAVVAHLTVDSSTIKYPCTAQAVLTAGAPDGLASEPHAVTEFCSSVYFLEIRGDSSVGAVTHGLVCVGTQVGVADMSAGLSQGDFG